MFICSMRMSKKKALALLLLIAVLVAGVFFLVHTMGEGNDTSPGKEWRVKKPDDVAQYIRSFGWEIEAEPSEVVEVTVPAEFNHVYENYNEIQKKQGFDLEPYKGMGVQRYTYVVTNYPGQLDHIRADVIVHGKKIIAADICSIELAGFMHGIRQQDAEEFARKMAEQSAQSVSEAPSSESQTQSSAPTQQAPATESTAE